MERLTYRDKDGFPMMKKRGGFKQGGVERLASYEDTGQMPEKVTAMRHTLDKYHKVVDPLIRAQADGRLVVLPCKVGDKLYRVFDGNISEHEVQNMKYFARQRRLGIDMTPFFPDAGKFIGKTVFFTREEAEAALEAMMDE